MQNYIVELKNGGYEVLFLDFSRVHEDNEEVLGSAFAKLERAYPKHAPMLKCLRLLAQSRSFVEVMELFQVYDTYDLDWPDCLPIDEWKPCREGDPLSRDVLDISFDGDVQWAKAAVASHAKNILVKKIVDR